MAMESPLNVEHVNPQEPATLSRSNSLTSNISTGSGVSLTRRSRTRTRARTLTGGRPESIKTPKTVGSDDLDLFKYSGQDVIMEPQEMNTEEMEECILTPTQNGFNISTPRRSPRSPHWSDTLGTIGIEAILMANRTSDSTAVSPTSWHPADQNRSMSIAGNGKSFAGEYVARRPLLATVSASVPASPVKLREGRNVARDSQQSSTSSSLFPQSTSASRPDSSSSPRSLIELESAPHSVLGHSEGTGGPPFDGEYPDYQEFNEDDVSFRLRLLVNNNYFLPPAHSKPSPSSLVSSSLKVPKKTSRATTPTFLDLFRVGKSKSKPPTPESSTESLTPVLRTTSDSTTASGYAPRMKSHSLPQSPSLPSTNQDRAGRVVVVREKMADIITAAKQAEQDMKVREGRRDREGASQRDVSDFIDVIDPTDAVDMPPQLDGYPFAVQASAMHGLGVQDSLGAAVLAECLPPMDPEEVAWRKALLHEAVNLSLHSPHSSLSTSDRQTPSASPASPASPSPSTHSMRRILDHRIISHLGRDDEYDESSSFHNAAVGEASMARTRRMKIPSSGQSQQSSSRPSSYLPRRAETPAVFHPLAPPPRRPVIKHSFSQTDLSNDERIHRSSSPGPSQSSKILRKTMSSPMLSDSYDSEANHSMKMAPPPVPKLNSSLLVRSPASSMSFDTHQYMHQQLHSQSTVESCYSEEEVESEAHRHRPSLTMSIPTNDQTSMSDYSQPSPATSAFKDALEDHHWPSQGRKSASTRRGSASQSRKSDDKGATSSLRSPDAPRFSTMSPPPRVSSSLADIALSPPPRKSSLRSQTIIRSPIGEVRKTTQAHPLQGTGVPPCPPLQTNNPPIPSTPPIAERRGISPRPASLHIPTGHIPVAVQSAPPPSSPTSFFDIMEEKHPNVVDEPSLSGESDLEESYGGVMRDPVPDIANSSASRPKNTSRPRTPAKLKKPLMRLGNNSTPHVNRPSHISSSPFSAVDRKRPISNTPHRASYFSGRKGKGHHAHIPVSTFDFYKQPHQTGELAIQRKSTEGENEKMRQSQNKQKDKESLQKLDGLLIQHMEAEKDTIKRIASSVKTKS